MFYIFIIIANFLFAMQSGILELNKTFGVNQYKVSG